MISAEFFYARKAKLEEYRSKGYLELREALELLDLEEDDLIDAGLLSADGFYHTAMMYYFDVTEKGKEYLWRLKGMDIILVRKHQFEALKKVLLDYSDDCNLFIA